MILKPEERAVILDALQTKVMAILQEAQAVRRAAHDYNDPEALRLSAEAARVEAIRERFVK
jgi:hypothetical protein